MKRDSTIKKRTRRAKGTRERAKERQGKILATKGEKRERKELKRREEKTSKIKEGKHKKKIRAERR